MSQTTTPSGADVDPLAVIDDLTEWAKAAGVLDYKDRCDLAKSLKSADEARTAVAALIARNAELEAENAHLAAFIGPSAMPRLRASLAAGLPAGGADQPLARAPANGDAS